MQDQLDSDRENDRRLREQIDPLVGELTPIGKIELATRLLGESMIDSVRRRRDRPVPVIDAAPVRVVRMLPAGKEEGESEEAPTESASPAANGDDAFRRHESEAPQHAE